MSKFKKLRNALERGLAKLRKYYGLIDSSDVYFISLGMFQFIAIYETNSLFSFGSKFQSRIY